MTLAFLKRLRERIVAHTSAALSGPISVSVQPQSKDLSVLRSVGLAAHSLPELEIGACPVSLLPFAKVVLGQAAANGLATPVSLQVGKVIGGRFVSLQQTILEPFTLLAADTGRNGSSLLRICDVGSQDPTECPRRLLTAHLCAMAERRPPSEQLVLFGLSVAEYPPVHAASTAALDDSEFNPNNFWGWEGLGSACADMRQTARAIDAWRTALCRWPRGGKFLAAKMLERARERGRNPDDKRIADFWLSVDDENIRRWCTEMALELPEDALTSGG